MEEHGECRLHPGLKKMVEQASRALALLDADRLEELALSCQALSRGLAAGAHADVASQAREAVGDMAVFARVLEVTRANLNVMRRLQDLRDGRLEYGVPQTKDWTRTENTHGDN